MSETKFPTDASSGAPPPEDGDARKEDRRYFPAQEEQNLEAYRELRKHAFYVLGGICVIYLVALLAVLGWLFCDHGPIAKVILSNVAEPNWHPLVLMGVGLVIFATVPLTIGMGLIHMASEGRSGDANKSMIKLPAAEWIKLLLDLRGGKNA